MLRARILLSWLPSVSNDVVSQRLRVNVEGEDIVNQELDPAIDTFEFVADEKTNVAVELDAYDGTFRSDAVTTSFNVGDLASPQPPVGLFFTIQEVLEDTTV